LSSIHGLFERPLPLEPILDGLPQGLIFLDKERRILYFNRTAEVLCGYSVSEARGIPCRYIFRTNFCTHGCPALKALELEESVTVEGDLINRNRKRIYIRVMAAALLDEQGELQGFLETIEDIRRLRDLDQRRPSAFRFGELIGRSPQMEEIYRILPMVAILGVMVAIYMLVLFSRKIKTKDLTPGLQAIREETRKMGRMKYPEIVTLGMLLLILLLWIFGGHDLGLGGPALLALLIPVIFGVTEWRKILGGISWDAWFMYCGALTLGALLKESGAALWLARSVLDGLGSLGVYNGFGLWVGLSTFSGIMTNFMSDAGTTALLGPIIIPIGIMSGHPAEPWASGLAVAFATSFAHVLIVGTPNNAIVYGLGTYPDTGQRAIQPIDFLKYGFGLWVLSLLIVWAVGFLITFPMVGFPEGILETARSVLDSSAVK